LLKFFCYNKTNSDWHQQLLLKIFCPWFVKCCPRSKTWWPRRRSLFV